MPARTGREAPDPGGESLRRALERVERGAAVRDEARRLVATERARREHPERWELCRHGDGRTPEEVIADVAPVDGDRDRWKALMNRVRARARELRGEEDRRPWRRGPEFVPPERRRESAVRRYGADGGDAWRPV